MGIRATLRFASESESTQQRNDRIIRIQSDVLSRSTLAGVMQDPQLNLYANERTKMPLEDVIEDMRHDVHIAIGQAGLFSISFQYPDRRKSQATLQRLVTLFIEEARQPPLSQVASLRLPQDRQIEELQMRIGALEKRLGVSAPRRFPLRQRLLSAVLK